jgi:hypothetical protein
MPTFASLVALLSRTDRLALRARYTRKKAVQGGLARNEMAAHSQHLSFSYLSLTWRTDPYA